MKRVLAAVMSLAVVLTFAPVVGAAPCPPEVGQAKDLLNKKAQDVKAPRSLAGAHQDLQAPRGKDQDIQAPRGKDQDLQAPRSGSQTPRSTVASTPSSNASQLIKEAEMACKSGDMKTAKEKADAAISILK